MKNQVLVILGMHRSGTSLITQWLYKCGLNIGDDLLGPGMGNAEGHFEDKDFLQIHEDILRSGNLSRIGLITAKISGNISDEQKEKIRANLEVKNKLHAQWGWKDPRTCLFLDHYRELLNNAKYIIIIRDCDTVVNSLVNRAYKKYEKKNFSRLNTVSKKILKLFRQQIIHLFYKRFATFYTEVWINYNEEILKHIEKIKQDNYILINYQMLIDKADRVYAFLKNRWLFDLNYYDFKAIYNEALINSPKSIEKFIKDKSVLHKARMLEEKLLRYRFDKS